MLAGPELHVIDSGARHEFEQAGDWERSPFAYHFTDAKGRVLDWCAGCEATVTAYCAKARHGSNSGFEDGFANGFCQATTQKRMRSGRRIPRACEQRDRICLFYENQGRIPARAGTTPGLIRAPPFI
jgi:hypothetical protein